MSVVRKGKEENNKEALWKEGELVVVGEVYSYDSDLQSFDYQLTIGIALFIAIEVGESETSQFSNMLQKQRIGHYMNHSTPLCLRNDAITNQCCYEPCDDIPNTR
jgi:hypothetical protein